MLHEQAGYMTASYSRTPKLNSLNLPNRAGPYMSERGIRKIWCTRIEEFRKSCSLVAA